MDDDFDEDDDGDEDDDAIDGKVDLAAPVRWKRLSPHRPHWPRLPHPREMLVRDLPGAPLPRCSNHESIFLPPATTGDL